MDVEPLAEPIVEPALCPLAPTGSTTAAAPGFAVTEVGTFAGTPGSEPVFRSDRRVRGLTNGFVGPTGMVLRGISRRGVALDDQSSAVWTGVYAWTQALRVRNTGDVDALADLRRSC